MTNRIKFFVGCTCWSCVGYDLDQHRQPDLVRLPRTLTYARSAVAERVSDFVDRVRVSVDWVWGAINHDTRV